MRSVLNVNLNTLFSSIQFAYPAIDNGSLMSDEWKWVLRTPQPTRPVLRFLPRGSDDAARVAHRRVLATRAACCSVSAGDGVAASGTGNEADMGTAFALATSLYGNNMLQVSGNVGYGSHDRCAAAGVPHQLQPQRRRRAARKFRSPCGSCSCPAASGWPWRAEKAVCPPCAACPSISRTARSLATISSCSTAFRWIRCPSWTV